MNSLVQDIRYAFRQLLRSPGFTVTAILTLALGIGANTAAFTLVYGMLLRPLPVPHPEQLYRLGDIYTCCGYTGVSTAGDFAIFSYQNYLYLKKSAPEFQELAAVESGPIPLSVKRGSDTPRKLIVAEVSGNYFKTFGVTPYLGRLLSDTDDQPNAAPVAVLNYGAWQKQFNSDPAILGSTILIESHPFRIVGIAERRFFGERVTDQPPVLWIPLASQSVMYPSFSSLQEPGAMWLWLVGRVKPGTDIQSLQGKLTQQTRQWLNSIPNVTSARDKARIPNQHIVLTSVSTGIQSVVGHYSQGLKLLLMLSSVVLLVACANVANLLLARGIARQDDLAIRMATGASRGRILRQIFTENLLLSCIGGIVALAIACAGSYLALQLGFPDATILPVSPMPTLPVLGFSFLVSLLTGLLFAAAPARLSMLVEPALVMRGSARSTRGISPLPQRALLFLQATLSLVLLVVAILTTRSLYNLAHQPMGFDSTNRYVLGFEPLDSSYPADRLPELYSQIESRFSSLGGVASVGLVNTIPFGGSETSDCVILKLQGPQNQLVDSPDQCGVSINQANATYFDAMGCEILQGRNFSAQDTALSRPVAIVSQSFAQRFFPNQNPLGRQFQHTPKASSPTWEIVGVFPDIRTEADEPADPMYYLPMTQPAHKDDPVYLHSVVVHFKNPPQDADGMLRRTMARVDPNLSISYLQSMDSLIGGTLSQQRVTAFLAVAFGILAIAVASIGLYGVTTYIVAQRTHEIGIRMALGSTRAGVIRLVLRSVLIPVVLGLILGIPCAFLAGYSIRNLLYQLPWYEPFGILAAAALLALCAIAAGLIPARRAASIQPMQALRVE